MLGSSFWKHAANDTLDAIVPAPGLRRRNRQKRRQLALAGSACAMVAFVHGAPGIGIAVYLITTLPFALMLPEW